MEKKLAIFVAFYLILECKKLFKEKLLYEAEAACSCKCKLQSAWLYTLELQSRISTSRENSIIAELEDGQRSLKQGVFKKVLPSKYFKYTHLKNKYTFTIPLLRA